MVFKPRVVGKDEKPEDNLIGYVHVHNFMPPIPPVNFLWCKACHFEDCVNVAAASACHTIFQDEQIPVWNCMRCGRDIRTVKENYILPPDTVMLPIIEKAVLRAMEGLTTLIPPEFKQHQEESKPWHMSEVAHYPDVESAIKAFEEKPCPQCGMHPHAQFCTAQFITERYPTSRPTVVKDGRCSPIAMTKRLQKLNDRRLQACTETRKP